MNTTTQASLCSLGLCILSKGTGSKHINIQFQVMLNPLKQDQVTVTMSVEGYFRYCHLGTFHILLNPSSFFVPLLCKYDISSRL